MNRFLSSREMYFTLLASTGIEPIHFIFYAFLFYLEMIYLSLPSWRNTDNSEKNCHIIHMSSGDALTEYFHGSI